MSLSKSLYHYLPYVCIIFYENKVSKISHSMDTKCIVFYFKKAEAMEIVSNEKKF